MTKQVDGINIPEAMDETRIRTLADRFTSVAEEARTAQKAIDKRRGSVADSLLSIARECQGREEFNVAYGICVARYKVKHNTKAMPKVYSQTVSDIRRMYDQSVNLGAKDELGNLLSYSKLKSAAAKQQRSNAEKARKAAEAAKPEYLKTFEGLVALLQSFAVDKRTETYVPSCAPIEEANEFLSGLQKEWAAQMRTEPEKEEDHDEEEVHQRSNDAPSIHTGA